jgi:putative transposase
MLEFLSLLIHALAAPLRTQAQLEAEIAMLRHQLNVFRRQTPRPRLTPADRLLFTWLCRLFPSLRSAITIVQPETVLRWHRSGFRLYWRWKSCSHSASFR